jgi:aldehyde dehydrogenase (NAD+)
LPAGDPFMGPIANAAQYRRVVGMIEQAVAEGATLLAGGPGARRN